MSAVDRRSFLKLAGGAAAMGLATEAPGQQSRRRLPVPPNALPPALQFQASPGGTGVLSAGASGADARIDIRPSRAEKPSSATDIAFLPVHKQAALIRAGTLSPVELTEIYLERLTKLDETLLCAVTIMADDARREAKRAAEEIAAGKWRGPLHGIPCGVKDLFSAKGHPTTWGAKPFEDRVIDEDAAVVERLRAAGAVILAKLSLGTFARGDRWYRGRTRNPWNTEQGSSGSSAGSASATVAGCVGFAIGTETLGSIVSPSRRCGLTGLRPTFGRVSRHGAMTLSWSMDKVGPMCRSALDCALVFAAIHGADPRDPSTVTAPFDFSLAPDLSKLRIGYVSGTPGYFLEELEVLGAKPVEVGRRPSSRGVGSILNVEAAAAFGDFFESGLAAKMTHPQRISGWRRSADTKAVDYLHAQRRRSALMREMADFMKDLDVYVSPTGDLGLTNLTGHPSLVLPYAFERQPRCITLVGDLFADDKLLTVAHAYQEATDWHTRRPELG